MLALREEQLHRGADVPIHVRVVSALAADARALRQVAPVNATVLRLRVKLLNVTAVTLVRNLYSPGSLRAKAFFSSAVIPASMQ